MFTRSLQSVIENRLHQKKAIILIGARQVGKSTLFDNIVKQIQLPTLTLNCDEPETRQILTDINSKQLALLIGKNKVVSAHTVLPLFTDFALILFGCPFRYEKKQSLMFY